MQPRIIAPCFAVLQRPAAPASQPAALVRRNVQPAPKQRTSCGISSDWTHKRQFKTNFGYNLKPQQVHGGMCQQALTDYRNKNANHPYDQKLDNPGGTPFADLDGVYTWENPNATKDSPYSKVIYREGPSASLLSS